MKNEWLVTDEHVGLALAGFLKGQTNQTWKQVKDQVASGKVFVDGTRITDPAWRIASGQNVSLRMNAPKPRGDKPAVKILFEDGHVVIIDKPSGVSSVPFHDRDTGTAMDLIREEWRKMNRPATKQPLFVVHRIDKDTSGILAFAKSKPAERGMAGQFRDHSIVRSYLCVVHGIMTERRIESYLLPDRGDGIRGSTRFPDQGKRAVTHVVKATQGWLAGQKVTVCEIRLETGKTHQIRIHMAENDHPIVGETVYIRDFTAAGHKEVESSRLLLHAQELGFIHPMTAKPMHFTSEPSEILQQVVIHSL